MAGSARIAGVTLICAGKEKAGHRVTIWENDYTAKPQRGVGPIGIQNHVKKTNAKNWGDMSIFVKF